jgi:hypothetical protein
MNMNHLETDLKINGLKEQLADLEKHGSYINHLLNVSKWLTLLLYFAFALSLYLGDILHLQTLITSFMGSAIGFVFYLVICAILAYVLAGIKHAAYSHMALFGRVVLIIAVVVSMGLLAEVFQSSANQDTKARAITHDSPEYQQLIQRNPTQAIAPDVSLAASLASAEQKLAQCEERLKAGKEPHCKGTQAVLNSLRSSQQEAFNSQAKAAELNRTQDLKCLEQLEAQGYNPTIRAIASVLGLSNISTAITLIMLFIAAQFECLHWWLSEMLARNLRAIVGLKQSLNREYVNQQRYAPEHTVSESLVGGAPYSKLAPESVPTHSRPIGFAAWPNQKSGTAEIQLELPTITTFAAELSQAGIPFPNDPVLNKAADRETIRRIIGRSAPRTVRADTRGADTRQSTCTVHGDPREADTRSTPAKKPTESDYVKWSQQVATGELSPTIRAVKLVLKQSGLGNSDAHRQALAGELLERMFKEGMLKLNPANNGQGINKAKYIRA